MGEERISLDELDGEIKYRLECHEEWASVRGSFACGDDAADKELEDSILRRLEDGDRWAWFSARVVAEFRGLEGDDWLGCCSYESEEDFRADDYFADMKNEAREDLLRQLRRLQVRGL